jgi:hypothetical protein
MANDQGGGELANVNQGALSALQQSGATVMKSQGGGGTALSVLKPRLLAGPNSVVERMLTEAALMESDDVFYAWEVKDRNSASGKKIVEGLAIGAAMMMARNYGNNSTEINRVEELSASLVLHARFTDFETNTFTERPFIVNKARVFAGGKYDAQRATEMADQVGVSKALRNVIKNALPTWMQDKVIDQAKQKVRGEVLLLIEQYTLPKVIDAALAALAKFGITEAQVLSKFGRTVKGGLTIDDIVVIQCDKRALERGTETPDALYVSPQAEGTKGDDATRTANSLDELSGTASAAIEAATKEAADNRAKGQLL